MDRKKITIPDLRSKKNEGRKITMLTAYDYPIAKIMDEVGIDVILVGDSVGMVVLGYDSTVPVTMDEMMHHAKAVRRGAKFALVVGDMPYMSYQVSGEQAIANSGRFIKEAGCDAVKIEWVPDCVDTVRAIVGAGIAVQGHIGLTPQTAGQLGGFKVQGRDSQKAKELVGQAAALEKAGCFSLVLECIPDQLARFITEELSIPTIGIGAGPYCDGQVLVTPDMLGLFDRFTPKFVKKYVNLWPEISKAVKNYKDDVEAAKFPDQSHSFLMKEDELKKIKKGKS